MPLILNFFHLRNRGTNYQIHLFSREIKWDASWEVLEAAWATFRNKIVNRSSIQLAKQMLLVASKWFITVSQFPRLEYMTLTNLKPPFFIDLKNGTFKYKRNTPRIKKYFTKTSWQSFQKVCAKTPRNMNKAWILECSNARELRGVKREWEVMKPYYPCIHIPKQLSHNPPTNLTPSRTDLS